MGWTQVDIGTRSHLDDLAEVHHRDPRRRVADNGEVVRDEEVRQVEPSLKRLQEVDDLRLDRHVECGDGFVENEKPWVERNGTGDSYSLPLTARELVRVTMRVLGGQTDHLQKLDHTLSVRRLSMKPERLRDDPLDRHTRVE